MAKRAQQTYDFYPIAGVQLRVEARSCWPVNEDLKTASQTLSQSTGAAVARFLRQKTAVGMTRLSMWAVGETSDLSDWATDGWGSLATWASGDGHTSAAQQGGNRVRPEPS